MLSENQYGFRKNRSTELAIFSLIDRILPAIENKIYAVCVFLDYSTCFDTLSRDILISKLYRYGVRGLPLDLIKSYFADRKQYVNYKDAKSSMVNRVSNPGTRDPGRFWRKFKSRELKNFPGIPGIIYI